MAAVELMKRDSEDCSKVVSTSTCYRLDTEGERKSEVRHVSKAFNLKSWKNGWAPVRQEHV